MLDEKDNMTVPEIDPKIAATLFELPKEEPEIKEESEPVSLLFDMPKVPEFDFADDTNENKEYTGEISGETILDAILDLDDNNHTKSIIIAAIEKLHNVDDGVDLSEVPDEDHEYIDDITIEDCSVDMYTLDGIIFNLVLKFDNPKNAYLKELNELCNRYRAMQEDMATNPNADPTIVPMFSLTFMPYKFDGKGAMVATFPIGYFRVLNDDGVNCSFFLQFWANNVSFTKIDIDEETKSEMVADVLREVEKGSGGQLFENE